MDNFLFLFNIPIQIMRRLEHSILSTIFIAFLFSSFAWSFDYPEAKRTDQQDEYFGTVVADPYRWMETNDTPELKTWIDEENRLTNRYFESIPFRAGLRKRLTKLVDYPKHSLPWKRAGRLFFFKNSGLQNQSILFVQDTPEAEARVLLDPNTLSEDGTVSLQRTAVSKNGKYLAYSLNRSGSDWSEINVLNIETGEKLADHLDWVKFSGIAWQGDGFYYSRYDAPAKGEKLTAKNEYHKIFFHRIGTAQEEDRLIHEDKRFPLRNRGATTDRDERFVFVSESETTYGNSLCFSEIAVSDATKNLDQVNPTLNFKPIVEDFRSEQSVVVVLDDQFFLLTDRDAPNKRLVAVDPKRPQPEHWVDVIPEEKRLLVGIRFIGGKFVVSYLDDATDKVYVYDTTGRRLREIELPTLGKAAFSGEKDDTEYYQSFTSYVYPTVIYRCNIDSDEREELFPATVDFNRDDYATDRVFYENSDGRKVPIFLTYKKGIKRNGNNPTLLYGYGGFNNNASPGFSAFRLPFLEQGGIFAHAVLRGGGEYGETWYKSGTKLEKQNVFDDLVAAAEFLIAEKYTIPNKLAIQGGSNGGLLVAATMLQRPDLFRAVVPAVGVLDMLRYHRFTIGWAWARDYGTSEDNREMLEYLLRYSPLHNVNPNVDYPAVLITTSDHDDRVVPAHSFKFAAEMQARSTSRNPVYIRIETKAGHGAGKPIGKRIDESTDVWSFIMDQLGMNPQFQDIRPTRTAGANEELEQITR